MLSCLRQLNEYCSSNVIVLLQGILSDLFPGITLPEHDYGMLQSGIIEAMENRGLQVMLAMKN